MIAVACEKKFSFDEKCFAVKMKFCRTVVKFRDLHFKKEDGQCFDNINSGESR
jgi:hypothetical protein